jgi:hypothetical protein
MTRVAFREIPLTVSKETVESFKQAERVINSEGLTPSTIPETVMNQDFLRNNRNHILVVSSLNAVDSENKGLRAGDAYRIDRKNGKIIRSTVHDVLDLDWDERFFINERVENIIKQTKADGTERLLTLDVDFVDVGCLHFRLGGHWMEVTDDTSLYHDPDARVASIAQEQISVLRQEASVLKEEASVLRQEATTKIEPSKSQAAIAAGVTAIVWGGAVTLVFLISYYLVLSCADPQTFPFVLDFTQPSLLSLGLVACLGLTTTLGVSTYKAIVRPSESIQDSNSLSLMNAIYRGRI